MEEEVNRIKAQRVLNAIGYRMPGERRYGRYKGPFATWFSNDALYPGRTLLKKKPKKPKKP